MGLINKVVKKVNEEELTKEDIQFILNKMRSANYKGEEFEQFFHVFKKLSDHLKTLK